MKSTDLPQTPVGSRTVRRTKDPGRREELAPWRPRWTDILKHKREAAGTEQYTEKQTELKQTVVPVKNYTVLTTSGLTETPKTTVLLRPLVHHISPPFHLLSTFKIKFHKCPCVNYNSRIRLLNSSGDFRFIYILHILLINSSSIHTSSRSTLAAD